MYMNMRGWLRQVHVFGNTCFRFAECSNSCSPHIPTFPHTCQASTSPKSLAPVVERLTSYRWTADQVCIGSHPPFSAVIQILLVLDDTDNVSQLMITPKEDQEHVFMPWDPKNRSLRIPLRSVKYVEYANEGEAGSAVVAVKTGFELPKPFKMHYDAGK